MNFQNVEFLISAASKENFPTKRLPEIAFAGKSNVGKSSVINRLLQRKNFARVGDKPGKTVHVNYFTLDGTCYLVDLPGYGFAKVSAGEKERWGRLMEDYFAANRIDLGVLIVDYRHPPTNNDITMERWFLDSGCPFVVVANKMDKLKKSELDMIVLNGDDVSGGMESEILFEEEFLIAVPVRHPVNEKSEYVPGERYRKLKLEYLDGETLILHTPMQSSRNVEDALLKRHRVTPGRIRIIRSNETALQMVAEDLGITFMREGYAVNLKYKTGELLYYGHGTS